MAEGKPKSTTTLDNDLPDLPPEEPGREVAKVREAVDGAVADQPPVVQILDEPPQQIVNPENVEFDEPKIFVRTLVIVFRELRLEEYLFRSWNIAKNLRARKNAQKNLPRIKNKFLEELAEILSEKFGIGKEEFQKCLCADGSFKMKITITARTPKKEKEYRRRLKEFRDFLKTAFAKYKSILDKETRYRGRDPKEKSAIEAADEKWGPRI